MSVICRLLKALNVVINRFHDIGFALFDELGPYTILHELTGLTNNGPVHSKQTCPSASIFRRKKYGSVPYIASLS